MILQRVIRYPLFIVIIGILLLFISLQSCGFISAYPKEDVNDTETIEKKSLPISLGIPMNVTGSFSRVHMVEVLSSTSHQDSATNDPFIIAAMSDFSREQVIALRYAADATDFYHSNILNAQFIPERGDLSYYSGSFPDYRMNGHGAVTISTRSAMSTEIQSYVNAADVSDFKISMGTNSTQVQINIEITPNIFLDEYCAIFLVEESHEYGISPFAVGSRSYGLRRFLGSYLATIAYFRVRDAESTLSVSRTFDLPNIPQLGSRYPDNLAIVAFIQNSVSKEIKQALYFDLDTNTNVQDF